MPNGSIVIPVMTQKTFTDGDKAAICGLLVRFVETWSARSADQQEAALIAKRIAAHNQRLEKLGAGFSAFDFDTNHKDVWDAVRGVIGDAAYVQAIADAAKTHPADATNQADTDHVERREPATTTTAKEAPTVRDGILAILETIAPRGQKANELRTFLESTYGMKLHEKTVGMTLYRLSRERAVRREGRIWFFVPSKAETKNPGGETPGLLEDLLK